METIVMRARDGADVETLLFTPDGIGPHPAVALTPEGTGVSEGVRRTAADLRDRGYVVIVPDFFRGGAPADPDDLSDLEAVMALIGSLDFRRCTHDVLDAIEYVRSLPNVDAHRVVTWGYCTGATIALLAAALDPHLAAAVFFYPSQPRFDTLDDRKPVHPIDLLWNLRCATMFLYGDQDMVMPPDLLAELRRRLAVWNVDHEVVILEGAGHAFCAPDPMFHHEMAAREGKEAAFGFLQRRVSVAGPPVAPPGAHVRATKRSS